MSEYNTTDVKRDETQNGTVSFATDVVATIAGLAANEVDGVNSMTAASTGLADMFGRKEKRNLTKGVRIEMVENRVRATISIVVDYGFPVPKVAAALQENVKKAIETMAGLEVSAVDVHVTGISFEREQQAAKELDEQQRQMLEESEAAAKAEAEAIAEAEAELAEELADDLEDEDDVEDDIDEEVEEEPEKTSEEEA
ncbi:MAG: Asp23/Gls24 family envelope stress response protein [Clostridia bacterium]|nr:Asp23/Gls24 family envelope stress response protein [Clostridia bacterium]